MASPGAQIADGATIVFGTSAFSAQVTSIAWGGITRPAIDTTHLGTAAPAGDNFGNRTFLPGKMVDPGEITMEIHVNPDAGPPIHAAAETITVTFNSGATWACTGFVTSFEITNALDDKLVGTMTVKMTGNINPTAAA